MNKRQRKKRARIENNWYKNKEIHSYDCPTCGWCALADENLNYHKVVNTRYGHPEFFGYKEWILEARCPCCGTVFEYTDSNM